MQGPGRKDPAAELHSSLIAALMELSFIDALPDRRMLLALIRRDVVRFPDVHERPEARLHVIDIVLACLSHAGGLRALGSALETMAPYAEGTRRVRQLIESATLSRLLASGELERARDLLRRADRLGVGLQPELVEDLVVPVGPTRAVTLADVFDGLSAKRSGSDGLPPAMSLLEHAAAGCGDSQLAGELREWLDRQADRLEVQAQLHLLRERLSTQETRSRDDGESGQAAAAERLDDLTQAAETGEPEQDAIGSESGGSPADPDVDHDHSIPPSALGEEGYGQTGESMPPVASTTLHDVKRLPQIWGNVPPRNPNFTGRESLLQDLQDKLAVDRETAVLPHAIHGMGGVGKSQVAIEYVHRHRADYDLIWWIPAEHESQILAALTALAHRLHLEVRGEVITAVPAVREALSTGDTPYQNWLLVFDNAEDPAEVKTYFPTGGAGKILITSRNPEWTQVARSLEVNVFTRTESTTFLIRRTPELTEAEADQLAEALGDLPLAVEQAAAWRVATGMSVNEYLQLLEEKRIELLEQGTSANYELSVAAAWNVSLDKLKEVNLAALQLLQVCSFFAPEPISRDLFAGSPIAPITDPLDETLRDPIKLGRAIRDIQRYALAKFDHRNGTLQMHRLVQAVLFGGMDDELKAVMRSGAHTLLANGDPGYPNAPDYWRRYQALKPHVDVSKAVMSEDPRVHELVFNMLKFLYYWGDHLGCAEFAEEVHAQRQVDLGDDHEHTLSVAKWRAWVLWVLGNFKKAAEINERSFELSRAAFGENDEGTLDAMTRVAIDLRTAGDFAGSLALDRQSVERCRREFGEDDPATLKAALHLGVSLRLVGKFTEARELDRDTHRRLAEVLGENDDYTMRTLNYLTIDIRESGDYLGARRQQEKVYERLVTIFGPDRPTVTSAAHNLAVARRKAGDHDGARKLAEETLDKFRARYGDDFPASMAAALNLAVDLRQTGDLDGAEELGEQTLKRYVSVFGERHPHTLSARANLAIVLRLQGDARAARASNEETLAALHAALGEDHPVSLTCATNLASDLDALGEHEAAHAQDIDTLARSSRTLGESHPSTLACSLNLALDLHALGRTQEADKIHAETMAQLRLVLGNRHPATLNALQSIRADCAVDPLPL